VGAADAALTVARAAAAGDGSLGLGDSHGQTSSDRKIGEGATGEVFRGALGGVPVAVKGLKLLAGAAPDVRAAAARRFLAESGVVQKYKSRRIVQLVGWAVNDDPAAAIPYALAFELLEGGSLAHWLRGPNGEPAKRGAEAMALTAMALVDMALGVAAGLAFLHGQREPGEGEGPDQQVLHRDVKPDNIGLTKAMDPKILDLGLAKVTKGGGGQAAASFTGGLGAGTVGYMAPEIASGVYTVASEVYSFGVLLLELLRRRRVGPRTAVEAEELAEDEGVGALAATRSSHDSVCE
jgi:serine/threonine protein kinase